MYKATRSDNKGSGTNLNSPLTTKNSLSRALKHQRYEQNISRPKSAQVPSSPQPPHSGGHGNVPQSGRVHHTHHPGVSTRSPAFIDDRAHQQRSNVDSEVARQHAAPRTSMQAPPHRHPEPAEPRPRVVHTAREPLRGGQHAERHVPAPTNVLRKHGSSGNLGRASKVATRGPQHPPETAHPTSPYHSPPMTERQARQSVHRFSMGGGRTKSEVEFVADRASHAARHQADAAGGGAFEQSKSAGDLRRCNAPVWAEFPTRRAQTLGHDLGMAADAPGMRRWTHSGPGSLPSPRSHSRPGPGKAQMWDGMDEVMSIQDPPGPKLRRSSSFNKTVGRRSSDFIMPEGPDEPRGSGMRRSGSAPPRTKLRSPIKVLPRNDGMSFDTGSTTDVTGITGQVEEYIHHRRAALADALDSSGRPFGFGDRIDPKLWGSLVEKYVYGGHYEYIVGDLGTKQQRGAAQEALDRDLMAALHARRSPEASPVGTMRAAFTDRSARMREGMHAQAIFDYTDCEPVDNTTVYHASTSYVRNRPRAAPTAPFDHYPAGVPSHKFHYNKINTAHTEHPETEAPSTDSPRRLRGGNSESMGRAIHKHDDCLHTRREVHDEEHQLVTLMCRKKRGGAGVRCGVPDLDDAGAAGGYNKSVGGAQMTRLGRASSPRSEVDLRHDMRMIMTPRDDDPPPPLQISPARRSAGACRVPSGHCEKNSAHYNQEVLRYEMVAGQDQPSMRTLPRDLSPQISPRLKRNPLNHEGWEEPRPKSLSRPSPVKAPHDNVAQVTNQIATAQQASDERAQRLASDSGFASSCSQAEESRSRLAESAAVIHQRNHHMFSDSVVTSLNWDS